jgi:large subunit ribosomal protein L3
MKTEENIKEDINQEPIVENTEESSPSVKPSLSFKFKNLIGKKIGMTQLFSDEGNVFPTTIVEAGPCAVTQVKNLKKDGYCAIQIGYSDLKPSKVNKAMTGHFSKSHSTPKKVLKEFRVKSDANSPKLGDLVDINQFTVGDFVKVTGFSIGKGFAGHMKRHGFSGGRASHGKNSVMRKAGSVGAGTDPGRIFPGMKMAGRMGSDQVSVKNLQVLNIDYENNLIFIKGAIPGSKNNYVYITKD